MDEKRRHRRLRFGRWIVAMSWGVSAVALTGLVLSYVFPRGDRMLSLPWGLKHVMVAEGVLAAGGHVWYENGEWVIARPDPTSFVGEEFEFTYVGIPHFFWYVRAGAVWYFEASLWWLFGIATAMAALCTWLLLRIRPRRSAPQV
jgi:hypothetical protein